MKRFLALLAVLLLLPAALAEKADGRSLLLITEYWQVGWGERYELGALDNEGKLWVLESDSRDEVPFDRLELLRWAEGNTTLTQVGTISSGELRDVQSLVDTVEAQEVVYTPVADDAGSQTSLAYRTGRDGSMECVVLGASGDEVYENTDPAAQALYRFLRQRLPQVTSFDGDGSVSPAGFQPVEAAVFLGYGTIDPAGVTVACYANDCEAGPAEIAPDRTVEELLSLRVTGKRNSMFTTGNTVSYVLINESGEAAAVLEFYGELLVGPDGMYSVAG